MGFMWKLFCLIVGAGIGFLAIEQWPKDWRVTQKLEAPSPPTTLPNVTKVSAAPNAAKSRRPAEQLA